MKFFVDTANVEDIKKANDMGVICGVTTNPSLIAKEGRDFTEVIKEIASIVDGPISGEVKATTVDAEGMIKEGREIAAIHPNMVVKIPMTVEGLKAVKVLSAEGIKTNVTLIFSANQAILAANAGATYVSPFLGRLDDISQPGIELIRQIADIFDIYGYEYVEKKDDEYDHMSTLTKYITGVVVTTAELIYRATLRNIDVSQYVSERVNSVDHKEEIINLIQILLDEHTQRMDKILKEHPKDIIFGMLGYPLLEQREYDQCVVNINTMLHNL